MPTGRDSPDSTVRDISPDEAVDETRISNSVQLPQLAARRSSRDEPPSHSRDEPWRHSSLSNPTSDEASVSLPETPSTDSDSRDSEYSTADVGYEPGPSGTDNTSYADLSNIQQPTMRPTRGVQHQIPSDPSGIAGPSRPPAQFRMTQSMQPVDVRMEGLPTAPSGTLYYRIDSHIIVPVSGNPPQIAYASPPRSQLMRGPPDRSSPTKKVLLIKKQRQPPTTKQASPIGSEEDGGDTRPEVSSRVIPMEEINENSESESPSVQTSPTDLSRPVNTSTISAQRHAAANQVRTSDLLQNKKNEKKKRSEKFYTLPRAHQDQIRAAEKYIANDPVKSPVDLDDSIDNVISGRSTVDTSILFLSTSEQAAAGTVQPDQSEIDQEFAARRSQGTVSDGSGSGGNGSSTPSPAEICPAAPPTQFPTAAPPSQFPPSAPPTQIRLATPPTQPQPVAPPNPILPLGADQHGTECLCIGCIPEKDAQLKPYWMKKRRDQFYNTEVETVIAISNEPTSPRAPSPPPQVPRPLPAPPTQLMMELEKKLLELDPEAEIDKPGEDEDEEKDEDECCDEDEYEEDEDEEEEEEENQPAPAAAAASPKEGGSGLQPAPRSASDGMTEADDERRLRWQNENRLLHEAIQRNQEVNKVRSQLEKLKKDARLEYARQVEEWKVEQERLQMEYAQQLSQQPVPTRGKSTAEKTGKPLPSILKRRGGAAQSAQPAGDSASPPEAAAVSSSPPEIMEVLPPPKIPSKPFIPSNAEQQEQLMNKLKALHAQQTQRERLEEEQQQRERHAQFPQPPSTESGDAFLNLSWDEHQLTTKLRKPLPRCTLSREGVPEQLSVRDFIIQSHPIVASSWKQPRKHANPAQPMTTPQEQRRMDSLRPQPEISVGLQPIIKHKQMDPAARRALEPGVVRVYPQDYGRAVDPEPSPPSLVLYARSEATSSHPRLQQLLDDPAASICTDYTPFPPGVAAAKSGGDGYLRVPKSIARPPAPPQERAPLTISSVEAVQREFVDMKANDIKTDPEEEEEGEAETAKKNLMPWESLPRAPIREATLTTFRNIDSEETMSPVMPRGEEEYERSDEDEQEDEEEEEDGDEEDEEEEEDEEQASGEPVSAEMIDINAPATDANVLAFLTSIFDKSGHRPEKDMRKVLKSNSMKDNQPLRIKDKDGETHYIIPRKQSKKQGKRNIGADDDLEETPEDPLEKKERKKLTIRYKQKIHRAKRQEKYKLIGEQVPKGRPRCGEAELLAMKMKELEERDKTSGKSGSTADCSLGDDAASASCDFPATQNPLAEFKFTVPRLEDRPSASLSAGASRLEVRHFYEGAAGRRMTPVASQLMVDDGEGYVDEVERLDNESAGMTGGLGSSTSRRQSHFVIEERRQSQRREKLHNPLSDITSEGSGDEHAREERSREDDDSKSIEWKLKNGYRVNAKKELVKKKRMGRPRVRPIETEEDRRRKQRRLDLHRSMEPHLYELAEGARRRRGRRRFPGGPGWLRGGETYKKISIDDDDAPLVNKTRSTPNASRRKKRMIKRRNPKDVNRLRYERNSYQTIMVKFDKKHAEEPAYFKARAISEKLEEEKKEDERKREEKEKKDKENEERAARGEPPLEEMYAEKIIERPKDLAAFVEYSYLRSDQDPENFDLMKRAGYLVREEVYAAVMKARGRRIPLFEKEKMTFERQRDMIESAGMLVNLVSRRIVLVQTMAKFRDDYCRFFGEHLEKQKDKGRTLAMEFRTRYCAVYSRLSEEERSIIAELMVIRKVDCTHNLWQLVANRKEERYLRNVRAKLIEHVMALEHLNSMEKIKQKKLRKKNCKIPTDQNGEGEEEEEEEDDDVNEEENEENNEQKEENENLYEVDDDQEEDDQIEPGRIEEEPGHVEASDPLPQDAPVFVGIRDINKTLPWPKKLKAYVHPPAVLNEKWNIPPVLAPDPEHIHRMEPDLAVAIVRDVIEREIDATHWTSNRIDKNLTIDPINYFIGDPKQRLGLAKMGRALILEEGWDERNYEQHPEFGGRDEPTPFRDEGDDLPLDHPGEQHAVEPVPAPADEADFDDDDEEDEEEDVEEDEDEKEWENFIFSRSYYTDSLCQAVRGGYIDYQLDSKNPADARKNLRRNLKYIREHLQRLKGAPSKYELKYATRIDDDQFVIFTVHRHFEVRRIAFEDEIWKLCVLSKDFGELAEEARVVDKDDLNAINKVTMVALYRTIGSVMIRLLRITEKMFFQQEHRRFINPDKKVLMEKIKDLMDDHEIILRKVSRICLNCEMSTTENKTTKKFVKLSTALDSHLSDFKEHERIPDVNNRVNFTWRAINRLKQFAVDEIRKIAPTDVENTTTASLLRTHVEHSLPDEWMQEDNGDWDPEESTFIYHKTEWNSRIVSAIFAECEMKIAETEILIKDCKKERNDIVRALEAYLPNRCEWPMISIEPKIELRYNRSATILQVKMERIIYDHLTPLGRKFDSKHEARNQEWCKQVRRQPFMQRDLSFVRAVEMADSDEGEWEDNEDLDDVRVPLVQKPKQKDLTAAQIWDRDYHPQFEKKRSAPHLAPITVIEVKKGLFDMPRRQKYDPKLHGCCENLGRGATVADYKRSLPRNVWQHIVTPDVALPECVTFETVHDSAFNIRPYNGIPSGRDTEGQKRNGGARKVLDAGCFVFDDWWTNLKTGKLRKSTYKAENGEREKKKQYFKVDQIVEVQRGREIVPILLEPNQLRPDDADRPDIEYTVNIDMLAYRESLVARRPYEKDVVLPKVITAKEMSDEFDGRREESEEEWMARREVEAEVCPALVRSNVVVQPGMTILDCLEQIMSLIVILPPSPIITFNSPTRTHARRVKRRKYSVEDFDDFGMDDDGDLYLPGTSSIGSRQVSTKPLKSMLKTIERELSDWKTPFFPMMKRLYVDEASLKNGIGWNASVKEERSCHLVHPPLPTDIQLPRIQVIDLDAYCPGGESSRDREKRTGVSRVHPSTRPVEPTGLQPFRPGQPGIVRKPTPAQLLELRQWKTKRAREKDLYI